MRQLNQQQIPAFVRLLNAVQCFQFSRITFRSDRVVKVVDWINFPNANEQQLLEVYDNLIKFPCGPGMDHPRGLMHPLMAPQLQNGEWRVEVAVAFEQKPGDFLGLRRAVKDLLYGLRTLHQGQDCAQRYQVAKRPSGGFQDFVSWTLLAEAIALYNFVKAQIDLRKFSFASQQVDLVAPPELWTSADDGTFLCPGGL